jgi:hypothetical protein
MRPKLKDILIGSDGKLRPLWRAAIFYALGTWLLFPLFESPLTMVANRLHLRPGLTPELITLQELADLIVILICTGIFALYERRRVDSYGLPVERAFGRQTFEGALAGFVATGAVAAGMVVLGGMHIHGLASAAGASARSAVAWLGANILIGISEELWWRSYFQQTLWKSIGFWPASIVIALLFTADHYFFKAGENLWDVITLISLSLFMSYSLLRTGTLWFAVGFHTAFDYMQLFVIGTPNGARVPVGRLLNVSFDGPAWLTGGAVGTEASFLMYPVIAILWVCVWWRYRGRTPLLENEERLGMD